MIHGTLSEKRHPSGNEAAPMMADSDGLVSVHTA
jgi:hypothetical protein